VHQVALLVGIQVEADADDVVVEGVEESVTSGSPYASATEDLAADDTDQNISTLKARKEELAKKLAEQVCFQLFMHLISTIFYDILSLFAAGLHPICCISSKL
jgi:hypothetical protein